MRLSTNYAKLASTFSVQQRYTADQVTQRTPIGIRPQSRLFRSSSELGNEHRSSRDKEQVVSKEAGLQKDSPKELKPESKRSETESQKSREEGDNAMSRRLASMREEALQEGGSSFRNLESAGFSPDLKARLEEKILKEGYNATFKTDNARAFSLANMPSSAGKGSIDNAAAPAWTGAESVADSSLRMLDDASKPMRVPFQTPQPVPIHPPRQHPSRSPGARLADAKDRVETYSRVQDTNLSSSEREAYRRELQERFTPVARPMPISPQGLSALATERIDDAIASGQFRNIKRGKNVGVERDHVADSPYIDTTEYLMNRIVKTQDVSPPWVQKQQELVAEIANFRRQIYEEWLRHAISIIYQRSNTFEQRLQLSQAYATAEKEEETRKDATMEQAAYRPILPLRDPAFVRSRQNYYTLSINQVNTSIRSYNLSAPPVTQKPYLNLDRELTRCYRAVAPNLTSEIRSRPSDHTTHYEKPPQRGTTIENSNNNNNNTPKGGWKSFWSALWDPGSGS